MRGLRGLGIITDITDPTLNAVVAVLYNVAEKVYTTDNGTQISPTVAAYLTGTKGVQQIGVGGGSSTYPETLPSGPVTTNLAPPATPHAPSVFTEVENWLMAGNHAMYAGLGGAAALLFVVIGLGGKRGRR